MKKEDVGIALDARPDHVLLTSQAAMEWLYRLPRATAEQRREFIHWIRESPQRSREFLLAAAWDLLMRLDAEAPFP